MVSRFANPIEPCPVKLQQGLAISVRGEIPMERWGYWSTYHNWTLTRNWNPKSPILPIHVDVKLIEFGLLNPLHRLSGEGYWDYLGRYPLPLDCISVMRHLQSLLLQFRANNCGLPWLIEGGKVDRLMRFRCEMGKGNLIWVDIMILNKLWAAALKIIRSQEKLLVKL